MRHKSRRSSSVAAGAMVVVAALLPGATVGASPAPVDQDAVRRAAAEREVFGLTSDLDSVRRLLDSGADVGSQKWGIPLTDEEVETLDLPGRMAWGTLAAADLLPYVESLSTYGGAYFDQRGAGSLTIQLTAIDPQLESEILGRVPAGLPDTRVVTVEHTAKALDEAVLEVWDRWPAVAGTIPLVEVGVDTVDNAVYVAVPDSDLQAADAAVTRIGEDVGVTISARPSLPIQLTHCSSRDHCHGPMKSGTVIREQSATTPSEKCSMGFHVRWGSFDEQFLTAGHCGFVGWPEWFMLDFGLIGPEEDISEYLVADGIDVMTVDFPAANEDEVSDDIYNATSNIIGKRDPIVGETVCVSLAITRVVDCGTMWVFSFSYTDPNTGLRHWGSKATGILGHPGDSGSPVYATEDGGQATAIGIYFGAQNSGGEPTIALFVKVNLALSRYGVNLIF